MNVITVKDAAAELLANARDALIFCHKNPDGDTLGCAFALRAALLSMGRRAEVRCCDEIPQLYSYMFGPEDAEEFQPRYYIAVDCSDEYRLGCCAGVPVDFCVDHHPSQSFFAKKTLLDAKSASCCEIMLKILDAMGVEITPNIADCLYTGISTDTGCFRFQNTTASTLRDAARMIDCGAHSSGLNIKLFSTKSRSRLALEREALATLEYHCGDRIAMITISAQAFAGTGARPDDLEGLSELPNAIEGVECGFTIREMDGYYKISARTHTIDAAAICAKFGGGGHARAAGCESTLPLPELKKALAETAGALL